MNFTDYKALAAVNASGLKHMAVSPLRYHYHRTHDRPDSPAMSKGRAIHTAVLEPDELPKRYAVWKGGARRGSAWTEFMLAATSDDLEILTESEYDEVLEIRDSVRAHPVARAYLSSGQAEVTLQWTDPVTGLACKARPDFLTDDGICVDLKSSRDISEGKFDWDTDKLMYHMSAAFYLNGLHTVTGQDWKFAFVAVESNPPHDVRAGRLDEDAISIGMAEAERLLGIVAECEASGEWPGAYPEESLFKLPPRAYGRDTDLEAIGITFGS